VGHKRRFLTATIRPFPPQKDPKINAKEFFTFILWVDYNGVQQQIVLQNNCSIFKQTGEKIMKKPTVGQKIEMPVYGKLQTVTVLAVHSFGTIDVETESGACFRITGLSFI